MPSYNKFQSDNKKYTKKNSRVNKFNPEFNAAVKMEGKQEVNSLLRNLDKWKDLVSFYRFYPDLWWDFITPEAGGIELDLDQRVFMRVLSRFYSVYGCFPRGFGKCVSADTILFTTNGLKEIGEFFNYQNDNKETYTQHSIDLVDRFGKIANSNRGVYSGKKPTIKITTQEGYSIEGSFIHPLLVMDKDGLLKYKKISDITLDDYICVSRNNNLWGKNTCLGDINEKLDLWVKTLSKQKISRLNIRNLPTKLDENIAYIIGLLISNGDVTLQGCIEFINCDDDTANNFKRIFETNFDINNIIYRRNGINKYDYYVFDTYLQKYFELIGIPPVSAKYKVVPKCILEAPKHIVSKFVRGLFDINGTIGLGKISYTTASEKLAKQVHTILVNFGIISSLYKKVDKDGNINFNIFIYGKNVEIFSKKIGFGSLEKQQQLKLLIIKRFYADKDIIPFQQRFVRKFYDEIKTSELGVKKKIYYLLYSGECLNYDNFELLKNCDNYSTSALFSHFEEIYKYNYFYSKVKSIEYGENDVYDIQVPASSSFIGNGIVNHNTMIEVMVMFHTSIFYPNMEYVMTAQTRENAAALLEDKYNELIKYYPLLKEEIYNTKFSVNIAEVEFHNGSKVDILANNNSSKGRRRKRIMIEESALLNNKMYEDALEPVANVPRRTVGIKGLIDKCEMNGQNHFLTTTGFRGSDEFNRNLKMLEKMRNLEGYFCLGSSWELACYFGRGESISRILEKKEKTSPITFARNYCEKWVGSSESQFVNANKLLDCRVLLSPVLNSKQYDEFILGVDVARSMNSSNNQTSICCLQITRHKNNKIKTVDVANLVTISGTQNFESQSVTIKKLKAKYNASIVVVDSNGLGTGLVDSLVKENYDYETGQVLEAWQTINTDRESENTDGERCIFELNAQSWQNEIVVKFIDSVESHKLRLLEKRQSSNYDLNDQENYQENVLPYIQTDYLIEEVLNLKIKKLSNGNLTLEKVVGKMDKDRVSSVIYCIWYAFKYMDIGYEIETNDIDELSRYIMW